MSHPTTRLDPAIHQPARLGILTAAAETKRIDFIGSVDGQSGVGGAPGSAPIAGI